MGWGGMVRLLQLQCGGRVCWQLLVDKAAELSNEVVTVLHEMSQSLVTGGQLAVSDLREPMQRGKSQVLRW